MLEKNISNKLEKSSKSEQVRKDKFDMYLHAFLLLLTTVISGRKLRNWSISASKFEIFPIFPILSRSTTRQATHIPSLTKFIILDIKFFFTSL